MSEPVVALSLARASLVLLFDVSVCVCVLRGGRGGRGCEGYSETP